MADKLICKGHITLLSEKLEQLLNRPSSPAQGVSNPAPSPALDDSDGEKLLWDTFLPEVMGESFSMWCTPQIEISTLAAEADFDGSEQRVDFLVAHPSLAQPLVVEIDGQQHHGSEQDKARDRHLQANGYRVLRIPADEVRTGRGTMIGELEDLLSHLDRNGLTHGDLETLTAPIRRAGQIQAALLHAISVGLVSPVRGFSVSTDLVSAGELRNDEFECIVSDLAELLAHVGYLYGIDQLGASIFTLSGSDSADLRLSFYGPATSTATMLIEDTYLPFPIKWHSRPTYAGHPVRIEYEDVRYFLERVFRKPDFLDGQWDIVSRALRAQDTVALLPTGAGKSIAFQLAGMLLPGRTIVIAPIISLIRDQVYNLGLYGIGRALGITSDLRDRTERELAYGLLKHGEAFFYYIAPERFQMAEFREKLRGMTAAFPVNMIVVDEAHCVSEWGHDFRTAYLRIGQTSRECSAAAGRIPPLVALTGTASRAVLRDLQRELQITDFEAIVTPTGFDRKELHFHVLKEKSPHKQFVLQSYLTNALPSALGLPPESLFRRYGRDAPCGLVFCPNVNGTYGVVEVKNLLAKAGIESAYYAGMKPKDFAGSEEDWKARKRDIERRFRGNELSVLVATKAFGMGIDKSNIRFTVHYGIPPSIEAFYQEAGRAGRDRRDAMCTIIVSDDRPDKNRHLLAPATPIEEVAGFVEETNYEDNDDITRALFFHVRSFRGVREEIEAVARLHSKIRPTGARGTREVPFGNGAELTEKALHRLLVIGVIEDYTVNYSARRFSVILADADRESVARKYVDYVASYQSGRAQQERRKVDALSTEWDEFVIGVIGQYVQFVYEVIEGGRRRAIAEMLAACQSGSGEELRKRILDYLQQDEFSEAVEALLSEERGGVRGINAVLANIVSPNDAARLRGSVARHLETYPDHPGLLLLRVATEALARDGDTQTVLENYEAFLANAQESYGLDETEIAAATGLVLRAVGKKSMGRPQLIEQSFVRRIRNREAMRALVAQAGIVGAQIVPWVLLETVSAAVDA